MIAESPGIKNPQIQHGSSIQTPGVHHKGNSFEGADDHALFPVLQILEPADKIILQGSRGLDQQRSGAVDQMQV